MTGRAAPYRHPVWDEMANELDFTARILENPAQFSSKPGNRPTDWYTDGSHHSRLAYVDSFRFQHGEENYYIAKKPPLRFGITGAVLGGWESPAYWQALAQIRLCTPKARAVGFYESTLASQGHKSGPIAHARRHYFRSLDAVVVPGESSAEAVASMGVDHDRIHVGFNPVDVEWIAQGSSHRIEHSAGHRFLFIGQLVDRKSPLQLVRAFDAIRRSGDTLTIVGKGDLEGDLRRELKARDLYRAVTMHPSVPYREIPALLSEHDTLVLPSRSEVWGLVVNEALAAGLHAVVSRAAGVARSVSHMQGVFLCDSDQQSIGLSMIASRQGWTGAIQGPAIRMHTPAEFAKVFLAALE